MDDDKRLIEDYLPIEAISAEASREKSVRKGHISTLHLWWARRPLVACRAAVYGALVPADRWVKEVELKDPPADVDKAAKARNGKKKGLNRKAAKEFVTKLCRYPKTNPTKPQDIKIKQETEAAIAEAQRHILEAHAERLTAELATWRTQLASASGCTSTDAVPSQRIGHGAPGWVEEFKWPADNPVVTYDDIIAGRAPRPRVLDMFAGGGAIPLEALRLGCEAYALDLNPVAHIIELCTLVYPQKYGKPAPTVRGMSGPKNAQGETTWGGLAAEVRYWGNWVLERVRKEIGDMYPPIPDPEVWATPPEIAFDRETGQWKVAKAGKPKRGVKLEDLASKATTQLTMEDDGEDDAEDDESSGTGGLPVPPVPPGFLQPVAYLWTRTVRCKNPSCAATVPLVRQTWLCKKAGRCVALKMIAPRGEKTVRFETVESESEKGLGFDPAGFSKAGNATCPFCGTVADNDYVKAESCGGRMGTQPMAVVCTHSGRQGKYYLATDGISTQLVPSDDTLRQCVGKLCSRTGLTVPNEPIINDAKNANFCILYGLDEFSKLFTLRQMLCLLTFSAAVRAVRQELIASGLDESLALALTTCIAMIPDKVSTRSNVLCPWDCQKIQTVQCFGRQALPMLWDFSESNPLAKTSGGANEAIDGVARALTSTSATSLPARVTRSTATSQPWDAAFADAVITDPPYYDNVPYADISDFFYVWLKRGVGQLYPEHFSGAGTPKKQEAVADATRHNGDKATAKQAYENMMAQSFAEANRVLKPCGQLAVVYAHKTTLGWSTLVDALRKAGFIVTEAWPLDTEGYRLRALNSAALASSIFLVARKREAKAGVGNYEDDVQPELQQIVRERVETLWDMGIAGADLVIACVGAGLRAFTKYEKVEYANGEEVPAERFLTEVETVVLDSILGRLSKDVGGKPGAAGQSLAGVDPATRCYILWRYTYKAAEVDAGEAIIFANGTHVELDGQAGLTAGATALLKKTKAKYKLRDFTERGDDAEFGLPNEEGQPAPLIDALHRTLWLMENRPGKLGEFFRDAEANREQMRLVAQALAGPGLKGGELPEVSPSAEQSALGKLLANWRSVVEDHVYSPSEQADRKRGQKRFDMK